MTKHQPVMSVADLDAFFDAEFPQMRQAGGMTLVSVGAGSATMRLPYHPANLRPGGTISGPAMFALADVGLYAVILAHIGPVGLAVTTNLNINFLNKPKPQALLAECTLLKLGKRLAIGDARVFGEDDNILVAHATGTYSIPPVSKV